MSALELMQAYFLWTTTYTQRKKTWRYWKTKSYRARPSAN